MTNLTNITTQQQVVTQGKEWLLQAKQLWYGLLKLLRSGSITTNKTLPQEVVFVFALLGFVFIVLWIVKRFTK
jgi:hypothetical protein